MFFSAHKNYSFYDLFETQKFSTSQPLNVGVSGRSLLMSEENISMIPDSFYALFAKLRKATIIFFVSVLPSISKEHFGSHFTDFHEIWRIRIFRICVETIEFSLKFNKNKGCFT